MATTRISLIIVVVLVAFVTQAQGQGIATSFDQLTLLVRPGDKVTIRDSTGTESSGKIDTLSSSSLTLNVSGRRREFREADVATILERHDDSLADGAKWGMLIGAGLMGGLIVGVCSDGGCQSGDIPWIALDTALVTAAGLGVGAGIDALIKGRRVIYQTPSNATVLRLAPVLGHGRRGVALSMRF